MDHENPRAGILKAKGQLRMRESKLLHTTNPCLKMESDFKVKNIKKNFITKNRELMWPLMTFEVTRPLIKNRFHNVIIIEILIKIGSEMNVLEFERNLLKSRIHTVFLWDLYIEEFT